jgi:enoyl-CoA hydratase/carnithine racemase
VGEYLALTGEVIGADEAIAWGLADLRADASQLPALWDILAGQRFASPAEAESWLAATWPSSNASKEGDAGDAGDHTIIDSFFSLERVKHIIDALERSDNPWALKTAATLRKRSPLMLHVALEQIRRARGMSLADDLRMERDMVFRCFHLRPGTAGETVEGIRALAVDKDYKPVWNPARIEDVKAAMTQAFFESPWTPEAHPLRTLGQP